LRVRVTALVESDDRLIARSGPHDSDTPTLRTTSRVVSRPADYAFKSRSGTTSALASLSALAIAVDDTAAASALADRIVRQEQDGRLEFAPVIPWLETELQIGDRIAGLRGRGLSFASRVARGGAVPHVLGKHYRFADDRLETELVLGFTELPT
jgi:hypothetical protein